MMKRNIDDALKAWSARHAPDRDHLSALVNRIGQQRLAAPTVLAWSWQASGHWPRVTAFATGVAATLLAVLLWTTCTERHGSLSRLLRNEGAQFAQHRAALATVFSETERLFGTNLQWVAQSGRRAELGLVNAAANGDEPMVVHLSVMTRRAGEDRTWRCVWQADVVARPDGLINLDPDGQTGNRVALWLHRLDDGAAFVESRLELHQPVVMHAETSEVLRFGASRNVTRMRRGDTEYLLLQTVAPTGGKPCSS